MAGCEVANHAHKPIGVPRRVTAKRVRRDKAHAKTGRSRDDEAGAQVDPEPTFRAAGPGILIALTRRPVAKGAARDQVRKKSRSCDSAERQTEKGATASRRTAGAIFSDKIKMPSPGRRAVDPGNDAGAGDTFGGATGRKGYGRPALAVRGRMDGEKFDRDAR